MNFDFAKSMKEISDTELIKIVTLDRNDYEEAALIAAENELTSRNLSLEQISAAKKTNEEQKFIRDTKANTPLDFHWKILALVFPGVFQIIISGIFKGDGYDKKATELTKWTLLGIGFYILLIILISVS
jgi:hypothetical protein